MAGFLNRISNLYKFNPETSVPDLSDKIIIVTGGNVGLGYQTVLQLVAHHPKLLIVTARSQAKFDSALSNLHDDLKTSSNSTTKNVNLDTTVRFIQMDLASLASVKSAADKILAMSDVDRIDVLVNNAGIMGAAAGLTQDGYEVHFGTNHMGHALFTRSLMPLLKKSSSPSGARIVNVSSGAYYLTVKTGWDAELSKSDMPDHAFLSRYGQSKLANVLHAKGLAKNYPGAVTAVAIMPGRVKTDLLNGLYNDGRDKFYAWFQWFYDIVIGAHPVNVGAWTQVWAATETEKSRIDSGAVYAPVGVRDKESPFAKDEKMVDGLWEWTEEELVSKGY